MFWVPICFGGRKYLGVLDTGATISIVAKKTLPCGDLKNIFLFYVDQFEQSSGLGHHPKLSTLVWGITYKRGGKVAGHGSWMAVVCEVSPVPSHFLIPFLTSCLPQPSAWEMGMWCTVVGTVRWRYLWVLEVLPIDST